MPNYPAAAKETRPLLGQLPHDQRLGVARLIAIKKMPYFASGIRSLVPHPVSGCDVIGVSKDAVMIYDPEVIGKWTAEEAAAVYVHEYMHIFLRHPERFEALVRLGALQDTSEDRDLSQVAADVEINYGLMEAGLPLPGNPMTPASTDLPPNRTYEEYCVILRERRDTGKGKVPQGSPEGTGSSGNPHPHEPPPGGPKGDKPGDDAPSPDEWPVGRTPAELAVQQRADAESVQSHCASKQAGRVPGCVQRQVGEIVRPRSISWDQRFAALARRATSTCLHGSGDETYASRNRAQSFFDDEYGDRAPVLMGEEDTTVTVGLCVDTSGSMEDEAFGKVMSTATDILRALPEAQLSVFAGDTKLQAAGAVRYAADIAPLLKGGGGTDFRPLFTAASKASPRPDVLVFATDGYGHWPEEPPAGMQVIWLIVNGQNSCPWGEVVVAGEDEEC